LSFTKRPSIRDVPLLKIGRHFRLENGDKIIVARNEDECRQLKSLYREKDHLFVPLGFAGPVVILKGELIGAALDKMLQYTKRSVNENGRITHYHMGETRILTLQEISRHSDILSKVTAPQSGPARSLEEKDDVKSHIHS